jgi:hypothetical protein
VILFGAIGHRNKRAASTAGASATAGASGVSGRESVDGGDLESFISS